MDLYSTTCQKLSKRLTLDYSTSFGSATKLFPKKMQPHIYNIYGMVRIADEIVDTYSGTDQKILLDNLEEEVFKSIKRGYSPNPIIHSFALTATLFNIDRDAIKSFYSSMRMDLNAVKFDQKEYDRYIHGSASVIGDMLLSVFTQSDHVKYKKLLLGARSLGSAYQKINFLRDYADDTNRLGRHYFPGVTTLNESAKVKIIEGIRADLMTALPYIKQLPNGSSKPVRVSYKYYLKLLDKLEQTPAEVIAHTRIRVPNYSKAKILVQAKLSK